MEPSLHINTFTAIAGLIGAVLGSSVLTTLINNIFASKKRGAEVLSTNVNAEVKLGEGWELFVKAQREEITNLRNEMIAINVEHKDLMRKYNDLHANYETLDKNYKLLSEKHEQLLSDNIYLKGRVIDLQKELEQYKK